MAPVVIVGGGVIGLFAAYSLRRAGLEVLVVDRGEEGGNCSAGNAGMVVPSHVIPLAAPGVVIKGLRWLGSADSPFSIRFGSDRALWDWAWRFYRASSRHHVHASIPHLMALGLYSRRLYGEFMERHREEGLFWSERGLLLVYRSRQGEREETRAAALVRQAGLKAEVCGPREAQALEPALSGNIRGAVWYPDDALLLPSSLLAFLHRHLREAGVRFIQGQEVVSVRGMDRHIVSVRTRQEELACSHLVVASGVWSAALARQLGVNLPLQPGKGYSFGIPNHLGLQQPAILSERKVTISPYGNMVRLGGTMEVGARPASISRPRLQGIAGAMALYFDGGGIRVPETASVWSGLRPLSPDGLPYIGPASPWANVLFATGHSMMGVSLAPATGELLAAMVRGDRPPFPVQPFSPDRYAR